MHKKGNRQIYRSVMQNKKTVVMAAILFVILLLSLIVIVASRFIKYSPPEHDPKAVRGTPEVADGYLYREIATDYLYSFSMAANLYRQEDGSLNIYLTDPEQNDVSLMCEIRDAADDTLYYKSGRILPGEYVPSLKPVKDFENVAHDINVKIYAFEEDTYLSAGTTELKLVLQAW